MNIKEEYLKKLELLEIDMSEISIQDYKNFSIVSFSDVVENEQLNVSVTFFSENLDYEIIVRRKVSVEDRTVSLEMINAYNAKYSGIAFYLENEDIYSIRIMEKYKEDIQEVITSITTIIEIILLNDI